MKRYFHSNAATGFPGPILFSWWTAETPLGYLASGMAIMVIAIVFEGLRFVRHAMGSNRGLPSRAAAALIHMMAMSLAYMLMLVVMTYDFVFVSFVVAGLGIGHMLWGNL